MESGTTRVTGRPFVLHVSGDFPDPLESGKTPAIQSLVDLTQESFDHHVVSINRKPVPPLRPVFGRLMAKPGDSPVVHCEDFEYGTALQYEAPGKGLFHRTILIRLGDWLVDYVNDLPQRPKLLVGHKLTIEGIVVRHAARKLGLPYALSIQGNTDVKIMRFRPDLRSVFSEIFHGAANVFPFAPWALAGVEAQLGTREGGILMLPCAVANDACMKPALGGEKLISVFHLRNHRVKNLDLLSRAMRQLADSESAAMLDIIGGGTEQDIAACEKAIGTNPAISLVGPRNQHQLRPIMNEAIALVMPSRRESFGLVFIEALLAGTPIIYPRGASVDGYFDGLPFAIAVDASSQSEIAAAIRYAIANERDLKSALAAWQESGGHLGFTRTAIAETFRQGLSSGLS